VPYAPLISPVTPAYDGKQSSLPDVVAPVAMPSAEQGPPSDMPERLANINLHASVAAAQNFIPR
jgi:hypothetical protein